MADLQPVDIKSRWRHNWKSAQVVYSHLVCDPIIWQPGYRKVVRRCLIVRAMCEAGLTASGSVPLPAPPSMHSYTRNDDAGIVHARSSGKITAMQIR